MKDKRTILLATMGSAGDVYPMLALGRGLQARGYHPIILTNDHFEALVAEADLPFIALGGREEYQRTMENPDLWNPVRGLGVVAKNGMMPLLRPFYDIVRQFDPQTTILAATVLLFGARIAHEKLGIPLVSIHLQPSLFRSVFAPPNLGGFRLPDWMPHRLKRGYFRLLDAAFIDPLMAKETNAFRAEVGLPPVTRLFDQWMFSPQKNIGLFPDWFAAPQPDWPPNTQLTGFIQHEQPQGMTADLRTFLDEGEPPIVFTPGTAMQHGADFFRESVAAVQKLGRRAILLTQHTGQVPPNLPPTVRHFRYVPLQELLPHSAALVYHGGVGTLAQALAAGIPHLVIPFSHDQPDNAQRLRHMGVGDFLPPKQYKASAVAAKLNHLLTHPATQQRCAALAQQVDFEQALEASCAAITAVGG